MAKKTTVYAKDLTSEELMMLLKRMPVRTLMKLAEHYKLPTTRETVAFDLSQNKKFFTIFTFELGFSL